MDQKTVSPVKRGPFVAGTLADNVQRATIAAGTPTVTPDCDTYGIVLATATDTSANTVANPIGTPVDGQLLTIVLLNSSGGVIGTTTWGNKFKIGTVTKPANGNSRAFNFVWDDTAKFWRQIDASLDVTV